MDRAIEPNDHVPRPDSQPERGRSGNLREPDRSADRTASPLRHQGAGRLEAPFDRHRGALEREGRTVHLSHSERQTMTEIGRFRTVALDDLARHHYNGKEDGMRHDLRRLSAEKLIRTHSIWLGKTKGRLFVVTLTKQGKEALERSGIPGTLYAGFVKPREVEHDAAIYRMYQAEAARIAKRGGQIRGVVLDYELKRRVFSPLAKVKGRSLEYARRQAEIAAENGLKLHKGHIQLPDLRIEYLRPDGQSAHTDLELATEHYRAGQLSAKAEAGFTFYAASGSADRLGAVFEEHEITAEILSL